MNVTEEGVSLTHILGNLTGLFNNIFVGLLITVLLFALIKAGTMWMIGSENPQQVAKAKSAIMWAVVGVILATIAVALVKLVSNLLNVGT